MKLQAFKKRLQQTCFPPNIATFLRTPILKIIYQQLLLVSLITLTLRTLWFSNLALACF